MSLKLIVEYTIAYALLTALGVVLLIRGWRRYKREVLDCPKSDELFKNRFN